MTDNQKIAYEWAKSHDYPSIAARYARELAGLVDDLQGAYDAMARDLAARTRQVRQLQEENAALRQQEHFREVTKKVEPLTLDDLRKMDGEPVWWWNKSAKPVCTICVWDRFMYAPMFANYDWQSEDTLKLSKYKWLKKCGYKPYRQKPEEVQK